jgi:hypothetical protein
MAPPAAQWTTLEEDSRPDAGPIVDGVFFDIEDNTANCWNNHQNVLVLATSVASIGNFD